MSDDDRIPAGLYQRHDLRRGCDYRQQRFIHGVRMVGAKGIEMKAERRKEVNLGIARIHYADKQGQVMLASMKYTDDLNACHDAAMWLQENHPEEFGKFVGSLMLRAGYCGMLDMDIFGSVCRKLVIMEPCEIAEALYKVFKGLEK